MQELLKIQLNFGSFGLKLCGQGKESGKERVVLLLSQNKLFLFKTINCAQYTLFLRFNVPHSFHSD